jgi:hypothetical protein
MSNLTLASNPLLMPNWIEKFLTSSPRECERITLDSEFRNLIQSNCSKLAQMAYEQQALGALSALHICLSIIYSHKFSITPIPLTDSNIQPVMADIIGILEPAIMDYEYSLINSAEILDHPSEGETFVQWLKALIAKHPASWHPFYCEFMQNHAAFEDIRFYLAQETNLDPRFDDILALLQVGTHGQVKMEIAGNYWDEMGDGNPKCVHTHLFNKALTSFQIDSAYISRNMLDEARISGNLSAALALDSRHRYKAFGYFGVTEYLTPSRFEHVITAWRRNGLPEEGLMYHKLHASIDAEHSDAWFEKVIAPTINYIPQAGLEIAKGALMRLNSSVRYLDVMLDYLLSVGLSTPIEYQHELQHRTAISA